MYAISAVLLILSTFTLCTFNETKNQVLQDTYAKTETEVTFNATTEEVKYNDVPNEKNGTIDIKF